MEQVALVNLTPHEVVLFVGDQTVRFPSVGVARAEQEDVLIGEITAVGDVHIPVIETRYGKPEDLPDPMPGVGYIVSFLTVEAAKRVGRVTNDLFTPADLVRDDDGQVVGCRALARH